MSGQVAADVGDGDERGELRRHLRTARARVRECVQGAVRRLRVVTDPYRHLHYNITFGTEFLIARSQPPPD